ncbi:MAG: hypothetical protein U0Y68_20030 [Blastocatellia bacterium]
MTEAKVQVPAAQKIKPKCLTTLRAQRLEAEAKLAASAATYNRLKAASAARRDFRQ